MTTPVVELGHGVDGIRAEGAASLVVELGHGPGVGSPTASSEPAGAALSGLGGADSAPAATVEACDQRRHLATRA